MVAPCRVCGAELPAKSGPGRPKVVCDSLDCRRENRRTVRGREGYLDSCLWCRAPLPPQVSGEPRKYCRGTQCKRDHLASRRADYRGRLQTKTLFSNLEEAMLEGFTVSEGGERPLSKSSLAHWTFGGWKLDGSCDFSPKMFTAEDGSQPEWLSIFLDEFGAAGADPGVTRGDGMDYARGMDRDPKSWWTKGVLTCEDEF